jgi:hypothetical protein
MTTRTRVAIVSLALALAAMLSAACSRSNNLLLGRVEAVVGTHTIVVTDCYRTSVPPPQRLDDGTDRFMPCRDADVRIRREELIVNARSYGRLGAGDGVLVDHGVVSITASASIAR